jgi:hypothetical protein
MGLRAKATTTPVVTVMCSVCSSASSAYRMPSWTASGTISPSYPSASARRAWAGTAASGMWMSSMEAYTFMGLAG